jgi:DHA1 family multidrug resistance protein-like MFS transporter
VQIITVISLYPRNPSKEHNDLNSSLIQRSSSRIFTPLGIGIALSLVGDQTLYVVLADPQIAAQAGISLAMVGIVLGINRLTRIFSNGLAGMIYDRSNRRSLMIISIGIGTASTVCYALARDATLLLIGRILWGISWSGIWIGANTMALDISSDQNRGQISGRLQMWFFLGVMFSSLAGGFFTDSYGYRGGLWISSGLTAFGILLWYLALPETRNISKLTNPHQLNQKSKNPFPLRNTLTAAVPFFALRFVFAGVLAASTILWLSQFLEDGLALSWGTIPLATLTGGFIAVRVLLSMLSAPAAGTISDWLGHRWSVLAIAFLIGSAALWMMASHLPLLSISGAFIVTIAGGGIQGLIPAIVGDQVSDIQKSRALSIVFTVGDLGSALGPAIGLMLIPLVGIGTVYQNCAYLYGFVFLFAVWNAFKEYRSLSTL